MVGDHIYLNIGGIFSLKPFNLTGIAGGLLFISLSFDEPLLKQYNQSKRGPKFISCPLFATLHILKSAKTCGVFGFNYILGI